MIQIDRAFSQRHGAQGSQVDAGCSPAGPAPQGLRTLPSNQAASIPEAMKKPGPSGATSHDGGGSAIDGYANSSIQIPFGSSMYAHRLVPVFMSRPTGWP